MDDDRSGGVEAASAERLIDGDTEQAELAKLAKQRHVEGFVSVVFFGLRVDLSLGELAHHLPEGEVVFGGVEQLHSAGSSLVSKRRLAQHRLRPNNDLCDRLFRHPLQRLGGGESTSEDLGERLSGLKARQDDLEDRRDRGG